MNENEKRPTSGFDRAVKASRILALISIAAPAGTTICAWLAKPDSSAAPFIALIALGWVAALTGYALSRPKLRGLPIAGVIVNLVYHGVVALLYFITGPSIYVDFDASVILPYIIFALALPVLIFAVIRIVNLRRDAAETKRLLAQK